jgi:DNA-directed RNA polymerase subunit L
MIDLEFLVNKNQNQLGSGFITLMDHLDCYCPTTDYKLWHNVLGNLESQCSENKEWGNDFQAKLASYLVTVDKPPSNREKVIVLLTLIPVLTGAQINIDPVIEERYDAEDNILESMTSAFLALISSECQHRASKATTLYISSALLTSGVGGSVSDQVDRYLDLVAHEREYTAADPTIEPPSIAEIQAYLDTTEEDDYTEALKKEIDILQHQLLEATDTETKKEINAELTRLLEELDKITIGTWKNIDAVSYPKDRIAETLLIREELASGQQSRRIGATDRFVRNNDHFLRVISMLIPPILFLTLLITTTISKA